MKLDLGFDDVFLFLLFLVCLLRLLVRDIVRDPFVLSGRLLVLPRLVDVAVFSTADVLIALVVFKGADFELWFASWCLCCGGRCWCFGGSSRLFGFPRLKQALFLAAISVVFLLCSTFRQCHRRSRIFTATSRFFQCRRECHFNER